MIFYEILSYILLIGLTIFMYIGSTKPKNSFMDRFTAKIGIVGHLFIPIGIFITYSIFRTQNNTMKQEATIKMNERGWTGLTEKLVKYYDKCPHFINSLYFDWQKKVIGGHMNHKPIEDEWTVVNYLSSIIFQSWEDYITYSSLDETGHHVWISTFLQWANSPHLKNNWGVLKANYSKTTQNFAEHLFNIIDNHSIKNIKDLEKISSTFSESKEFKDILEKRFLDL